MTRVVSDRISQLMKTDLRTMDAIHLGSALVLSEQRRIRLVFATHDREQATAARALGFECVGSAET